MEMLNNILLSIVPIMFSIIIHEVAHGYAALKLGDPTAKMMGRITLNPAAHIDLFGTIIMPVALYFLSGGKFLFGYAKPVPINSSYFKNPRSGMAISAAAGPLSNVILATLSLFLIKHVMDPALSSVSEATASNLIEPLLLMLAAGFKINIVLAALNILPIPPLDGSKVLMGLVPYRTAVSISRVEPYGMFILLFLMVTNLLNYLLYPMVIVISNFIKLIVG